MSTKSFVHKIKLRSPPSPPPPAPKSVTFEDFLLIVQRVSNAALANAALVF